MAFMISLSGLGMEGWNVKMRGLPGLDLGRGKRASCREMLEKQLLALRRRPSG